MSTEIKIHTSEKLDSDYGAIYFKLAGEKGDFLGIASA